MQILPGWRNSHPLDPEHDGQDQWHWTIPATPPDVPRSVWLTLSVRCIQTGAWEWEIYDPHGEPLWAGTGSTTLQTAVTRACQHLTDALGTPLAVLT